MYGWAEGLNEFAPDQADKILVGVAAQLLESEQVRESDKTMLRKLAQDPLTLSNTPLAKAPDAIFFPDDVVGLLEKLINGIPRAMFPLKNRREGKPSLEFDDEYDLQTLIHVLVRPWIKDIRPEEYTPSYAGSSTRVDFLFPKYGLVLEAKFVRDKRHAAKIGDELIIDIARYKAHPGCKQLWAVIYDPDDCIQNPKGMIDGLEQHSENIKTRVFILGTTK